MGRVVLILLAVAALTGGAGAGWVLRPAGEVAAEAAAPDPVQQIVSLKDGFVVPVLRDGRIWTHVVLTLAIEAHGASEDDILRQEPVLRDALTEALFRHGSLGGFDGDFTGPLEMNRLRTRLNEVVASRLDDPTARVLIVAMARQAG